MMRTQQAILERLADDSHFTDDLFGVKRSDLVTALPFDAARPFLVDDATREEWQPESEEQIRNRATAYVDFAVGKAEGHRGLSAGRSVQHMETWVWLLFDDDTYARFVALPYENYGAPKIAEFARLTGSGLVPSAELARMAQGEPCTDDCYDGCGS